LLGEIALVYIPIDCASERSRRAAVLGNETAAAAAAGPTQRSGLNAGSTGPG
jgi:hypothetical protein